MAQSRITLLADMAYCILFEIISVLLYANTVANGIESSVQFGLHNWNHGGANPEEKATVEMVTTALKNAKEAKGQSAELDPHVARLMRRASKKTLGEVYGQIIPGAGFEIEKTVKTTFKDALLQFGPQPVEAEIQLINPADAQVHQIGRPFTKNASHGFIITAAVGVPLEQQGEEIKASSQHKQGQDLQRQLDNVSGFKLSGGKVTLDRRIRLKRSDNDPQPSSSSKVGIIQQSIDETDRKLEEFVKYFVKEFEAKLNAYHLILEGEAKKEGKFSSAFSEAAGQGVGVLAGCILGLPLGLPVAGGNAGSRVGKAAGEKLGSKVGNEEHTKKVIKLSDVVDVFLKDKAGFRRKLVESGYDIFQSFEMQFRRVSTDQGPRKAMQLLARDATNRAIGYYMQNKDASITEGVILGKSKIESVWGLPVPAGKTPGFEIDYKYIFYDKEWSTASLYEKAGLVIEGKDGSETASYYERKDGQSRTDKYGYRRLLTSESWGKLKEEYVSSNIKNSERFTGYQFILNSKDSEQKMKGILERIDLDDKMLEEERLTRIIKEVKDDIVKVIHFLKELSVGFEEDRKILESIEANIENMKVNDYLERFERYYEEAREERRKIAQSIKAIQEENRKHYDQLHRKQDIHHDDNRREHGKTQDGIERVVEGIDSSGKKIDEIHNVIVQQENAKKGSVWFDIKDPVRLFTGRKKELSDLHSNIQRSSGKPTVISQMISISGLGGIGETELARQYIHEHHIHYNDVVWVNAENEDTLMESFLRLATDELGIKKKNMDGTEKNIKSIVNEVYKSFNNRRSLFIFDNAEVNRYLHAFLPKCCRTPDVNTPYILFTSRNREWEKGIQVIDLNELTPEDAMAFVKKGLSIEDESQDVEIKKLVETLQNFPLAIQQAIACIEDHITGEYGISDYLKEYEKRSQVLLNSEVFQGIDNDYTKTTFTTWKITLDKIKNDKEHGQLALKILDIMDYLSPEKINRKFFLNLANGNEEILRSAVRLLVKYSMVNGKQLQSVLSIHRLVQEIVRLELKGQRREIENLREVLRLIRENPPEENRDHVLSVWNHVRKYSELVKQYKDLPGRITGRWDQESLKKSAMEKISESILQDGQEKSEETFSDTLDKQYEIDPINFRSSKPGKSILSWKEIFKNTNKVFGLNRDVEERNIQESRWLNTLDQYKESLGIDKQAYEWRNRRIAILQMLSKGPNMYELENYRSTLSPLLVAAWEGQTERVKNILDENESDLNVRDTYGDTLLHLASANGHLDTIKYLTNDKNADVNVKNSVHCTPLHMAAQNGYLETVKYLIELKRAVFTAENVYGQNPLHFAATNGHLDVVKYLIDEKNAAFDVRDFNHFTPLHLAAWNGNLNVIKYLIDEKGAKVNVKNNFDITPLQLASQNGHLDTVKYLINEREADLSDSDSYGNNPLLLAAENGHLDIVKFLINEKKADIDVMNIYSCNAVLLASANGHLDAVKYLVDEKNMDYNVGNRFLSGPLHFAALNGHLDIVKYLIDVKGAEVDVQNVYGFTPLHLAAKNGHLDTVKYLVDEKNANINKKNVNSNTPMHLAAQGGHLDTLRYLIDVKGAGFKVRNVSGSTSLHFAAQNGHLDTVKYLVDEKRATVNVKDLCHSTPILLAARNGHLDVLKYLINEKKGDFHVKNLFGISPVHLAAQNGHLDVLKYLIDENDAFIDEEDNDGNTPLHLVASNGQLVIVKYLIDEKNANFNAMDVDKCTPLHLAALNGHLNTVKYLIEEKYADIDVKDVFHCTPFTLASLNGHLDTVKYFIDEKNADFQTEDIYGRTSLHLASANGHLDTVKYLIEEKGTDVNLKSTFGATPLFLAAQNGHIDTVKYLIDEKHADVDVHDIFGNTLLHWATQSGNVDTVKYILQNTGDILERKNQNDETALHWAAKIGYPDIIEFLLVQNANPNVQDKHGQTPLRLAHRILAKYQENPDFSKILSLLRKAMYGSKSEDQKEQVSAGMSLEECLPGSSSISRRKREAKFECLFTWEDMDKFNTEVDEKRSVSKIKIDSEKFINYIQELTEEKRRQLIGLAEQVEVVGKSQSLVNKLISYEKVTGHLDKVGRVSSIAMHGMMAKNVLADILNGNYQGVAFNVGFIAGGQGFAKVAQAASIKGLEIASEGKLLLGRSLKVASPFLARGTSAFVIYDLVNQVKEFRNGTEEALAGIVGDGMYLGVDSAEIGVEVAEAFEILEGVSSVTGPVSAAIGAAVFIGTDVYRAVRRVDRIDLMIHLKASERFIEGLRAFIGMKPEKHIQEFMEEKQLNNELVMQGLEYLQRHGDIRSYVFPTGKSVAYCRRVPYTTTKCVIGGFSWCSQMRTVTSYTEKCTTKFAEDLDNTVLLSKKRNGIRLSRAKPDDPRGGYLFCLPQGDSDPVPSYGSYLCNSAIGLRDLSSNKTGSYTLINLGKGEDYAEGLMDSPNIFVVNDGLKRYHGGNEDDTFILQGDQVKGYLSGRDGINTLDLTGFAPNLPSVDVVLDRGNVIYNRSHILQTFGINKVIGRKDKSDRIFSACETQFLDGRGGAEDNPDIIMVENRNCTYKMQMTVRPYTVVCNCASKGNFYYYVPYALGSAKIDFLCSNEAVDSNNTFTFEYEPTELKNIDLKYVNVPNKTFHVITFNFSPMSDKEFNVTISGAEDSVYRFGNNTEIKVGNKGNLYLLQNTYESVDEIIRNYLDVANRLNKMSFFIQSLLCNETVVIGSGNHEVIHNNPLYKSHLVGNGGENVYVIDSGDDKLKFPIPEVHIYDLDAESSVDTIDLRNLVRRVRRNFSDSFELRVLKSGSDLLLKASEVKPTDDLSLRKHDYFTVRLKDGVNWYKKTHVVIDVALMKISFDENQWSLEPLPLKFENNVEVMVITTQDVEENAELSTRRKAGNYMFIRGYRSDLMVTNAFDPSISKLDRCTIVLSKFYEEPKLETLSIKFADKEVVLREHHREINKAIDLRSMETKHRDKVYKEVFGSKEMIPEVVMLSDQPVV